MDVDEYNHTLAAAQRAARVGLGAVVANWIVLLALCRWLPLRPVGGVVVAGIVATILFATAYASGCNRGRAEQSLSDRT